SSKEKLNDKIALALEVLENTHKITHALESVGHSAELLKSALLEASALLEKEQAKLEECERLDIEKVLERLGMLSGIIKDYGSIAHAKERLGHVKNELHNLKEIDHYCETYHKEIEQLKTECLKLCEEISGFRKEYLAGFNALLSTKAKDLLLKSPSLVLEDAPMSEKGAQKLVLHLQNSQLETLSSGEYSRLR
ncbi:DNA repair protein RecN, partial [Helicobacter pylori]